MKAFLVLFVLGLAGLAQSRSPFFRTETTEVDSSEHGGPAGRKGTTCKCGWANKSGLRVVGGRQTKMHEFPFTVAVIDKEQDFQFCGGTIVTPSHVITAAHCTEDYLDPSTESYRKPIEISAGDHNVESRYETTRTQRIGVARIYQHEQYNTRTIANDISVLYLARDLIFDQAVGPACMLQAPVNLEEKTVKVIGWGKTSHYGSASPILKTVNLRVVPHNMCAAIYPNLNRYEKKQVCTHSQEKGACMGDSGGPLVWVDPETNRYTLAGVVSFGRVCASDDPSVFTDPAAYLDWIKSKISVSKRSDMCYKA